MTIVNTYLGPHSGQANNPLTFEEAFAQAQSAPSASYQSRTGQPFQVVATVGQKGIHANKEVLKFMDGTTERARAYVDCWGHTTNCKSQHIDLYSEAMTRLPAA